jgi:hypothetical protein
MNEFTVGAHLWVRPLGGGHVGPPLQKLSINRQMILNPSLQHRRDAGATQDYSLQNFSEPRTPLPSAGAG